MARITQKQKDIAERMVKHIENTSGGKWRAEILANIRKENEYMAEKEKAQTPTREQMQRPYDL